MDKDPFKDDNIYTMIEEHVPNEIIQMIYDGLDRHLESIFAYTSTCRTIYRMFEKERKVLLKEIASTRSNFFLKTTLAIAVTDFTFYT